MLKGRAATTAERTAKGAGRAAARTMEEPREAARNRAADCMAKIKRERRALFGEEEREKFRCLERFRPRLDWQRCFGAKNRLRGGGDD